MAPDQEAMRGKICVVTGATSGIGRETAIALAERGATVLLVGRDAARGAAVLAYLRERGTLGESIFLAADLSTQAAVRQLAAQIRAGFPRIDVLINNAGGVNPVRKLTADGLEQTFAVNHVAPFLLTQLLRDVLVASAPARVVTVSSEAHRMVKTLDFGNLQGETHYKPLLAYAISKLGNVLFTYELSRQLRGTGVTANCLHPGVVRTGIWQASRGLLRWMVTLAKPFMLSSRRSARALVFLAADPGLAKVSGRYYIKGKEVRSSELSLEAEVSTRLWAATEALVR